MGARLIMKQQNKFENETLSDSNNRHGKKVEWTRLDNAAKIFPPTSNEKDTKVFRFSCELFEGIEPDLLQQALDETMESFPLYRSVLRKGLFWYYLETSNINPLIEEESNPVCGRIYNEKQRNLLFRVFYYKNRINLEIFHALSDGYENFGVSLFREKA
jgi:hypothetical protein